MILENHTITTLSQDRVTNDRLLGVLIQAATAVFGGYLVMGGVEQLPTENKSNIALNNEFAPLLTDQDFQDVQTFLLLALTTHRNSFERWKINKQKESLSQEIIRAQQSVRSLLTLIQQNIKSQDEVRTPYKSIIEQVQRIHPDFLSAAVLFSYDNIFSGESEESGYFQRKLHKRIGLRKEIDELISDTRYLHLPANKRMLVALRKMHPGSLLVLLATQFAKPLADGEGLYTPAIYRQINQTALHIYPSQDHLGQEYLNIYNTYRYFKSVDQWIRSISNLTLNELITLMHVMEKEQQRLTPREKS